MARVVLAMSGGVDSSVAARLLCHAGHDVIGVFMRHGVMAETACASDARRQHSALPVLPTTADHKQGCCSAADAEDARRVADRLDIPFYAINFDDDFGRIVDYFVDEYTAGRTPNPCVACNNWIKFGKLWDYAGSVGADYIATGHYARLVPASSPDEPPALCMGRDESKDQSYVLFGIDRDVLRRVMFPVGDYRKSQIREIAIESGLHVADKRDSQEICFVPDGDYAGFVRRHQGASDTSGEIVTTDGTVVGQHEGIERFTIGQRKRLGIALGEPHFVVRLEPEARRVVIGSREELGRRRLTASGVNWFIAKPRELYTCRVKIRYNSPAVPASVSLLSDGRIDVAFDEPQMGVAPGQAVVCYDGDRVLGGGWID